MNKLKITLNEDGSVYQFTPDFKIMRGSYRNVLLNIEVPHSLLIDPVTEAESGTNKTGNNVRVGAIIETSTGKHLQTKRYELQRVKDFERNNVKYRLYQRKMPKEFTMWDTVNETEAAQSGELDLVINVVNWTKNGLAAKIEEVSASPTFKLPVYPSAFLDNAEEIEDPTDFDELQSQVQEIDATVDDINADLYGEDGKSLGEYLTKRLKAGNKIILKKEGEQIKISVETIKATEVVVDPIADMKAANVQKALEELSKRTDSQQVDTVKGEDSYLVDNTDPRNPIIKHDISKIDKSSIADNQTTTDPNKVLSANQGAIIKRNIDALQTSLISEQNARQAADNALQGQITTLDNNKASKTEMTEAIASAINAVVNSAPEAFDTLKEIADWIEQDEAGSAALVLRLAAVEAKNSEQDTAIANEVSARTSADNTLQSNIDAETSARESAINSLTNSKLDSITIESGTNDGTLKITKVINGTSSTVDNIPVKGLKSAAFTEASAYATAAQGAKADTALQAETDPTVPSWAKNATKPTYTAAEVGAMPANAQVVSSINGESGTLTGYAKTTYVDSAIQEAIGNAIGGEY